MSLDEIVFTREALRRELVAQIDVLDKAAESYDPELDTPVDDFVAAMTVATAIGARNDYVAAVSHRITTRAQERGL